MTHSSPSLSWEDGLYGFVGFGDSRDREASSTSIIPTFQLGKVKRGQKICPGFPLQGSGRAGNKIKSGPKAMVNVLRCSGKVELVAALDVEHEVSSIEVFHHKKEVFLEKETR